MDPLQLIASLTTLDLMAFGFVMVSWLGSGWIIEHPPAARPSVSVLMKDYRRAWMIAFIDRQPRIFDAQILGTLRQGTTFFASTNVLAIGGALALIGNASQLNGLTAALPGEASTTALRVKLLAVVFFLAVGFLKFVWASRLFGYCAVVMASVPNDPEDGRARIWAAKAAEINIRAALNFNRGLRATYFALATLGWLLGPWALASAAILTFGVLWQREFASLSQTILAKDRPQL
ncbi:MAG: DUF599 domain-containing protein [Pseudomonadota bacterium]